MLHNFFFSDTGYQLLGFYQIDNKLHTVVKQAYIQANEITELSHVSLFLENNGFKNTRNHDYSHPELGIILENLHDENVLT